MCDRCTLLIRVTVSTAVRVSQYYYYYNYCCYDGYYEKQLTYTSSFNLHDNNTTYEQYLLFTDEESDRVSNHTASKGVTKHQAV